MDKWRHDINETSSLFQGHVDQLFSLNKIGFRINFVYEDLNKLQEINNERYRRSFVSTINKMLERRAQDGYECQKIIDQERGLKIVYPRLSSDRDDDQSGSFELYPKTAMCPKCNKYIRLGVESDKCSCNVKLTQFTFIAFCDECGAHYPIDPMSNVLNDCKKCNLKNGLRKLNFRQPDDLSSYSVSCINTNCDHSERLVLYRCDHTDHQTGKILSKKEKSRFRGVPARSGAILHPMILAVPDIPTITENGLNKSNDRTRARLFSEAFNYFFKSLDLKVQESLLFLPSFWESLASKANFWSKDQVKESISWMDLNPDEPDRWELNSRMSFIQGLIIEARNRVSMSNKQAEIRTHYGINEIEDSLNEVKEESLDEREQQGAYLIRSSQTSDKGETETYAKTTPETGYPDNGAFLNKLGITSVAYLSNLEMIQALLGVVEGSMRRDPLLFRTLDDVDTNKPTVYVRKMLTEGVYFQLNSDRVLRWLESNGKISNPQLKTGNGSNTTLRNLVSSDEIAREEVHLLLHTLSHTLIQNASINTGLETQSISEMLFPSMGMILLYSTNPVNVGGIEYTYDNMLYDWLKKVTELAEECPQDPGCLVDEGGSCNACLFVPEFVCESFNEHLDRDCLIGKRRYQEGYLDV